jgi:two-component sensor histidine kinase
MHHSDSAATALQVEVLEMITRGRPLDRVFASLAAGMESLLADAVVGMTVLDRASRTFEHAIFPSLGTTYESVIPGLHVADQPGSCAAAVYHGHVVHSDDIASDARFQPAWRQLHTQHNVKAIQSHPVFTEDGTSLGTFVIGFREPRPLTPRETELIALGVHLTGLALIRHRADQQQELLVAELHHRIKNVFASIGSLVYFTLRTHGETSQFRQVFDGRLAALARAHNLAVQRSGSDMRALIGEILAPYATGERITLAGPVLTLSPEATVAFSLAMHELATNATKYGALSNSEGKLHIAWQLSADAANEPVFHLDWVESGGPAVAAPVRTGFGRNTIEQSLAQAIDGRVSLDFAPAGLVCRIVAPVSERLGRGSPKALELGQQRN